VKNILEAEIWGIARAGDGSMVFLRPLNSDYAVPIFIGQLETQTILIGYGNVSVPRPLTPDLLLDVIRHAGLLLLRVEISEIRENTFFARLVLCSPESAAGSAPEGGGSPPAGKYTPQAPLLIDARPSDALALAVRSKCPIYVAEKVLSEAGILAESIIESDADGPGEHRESLREELEAAVAAENYEKAAELRDILKQVDRGEAWQNNETSVE
jgi:bifunctional DNase/RNase